jgi:hypothetical protein
MLYPNHLLGWDALVVNPDVVSGDINVECHA